MFNGNIPATIHCIRALGITTADEDIDARLPQDNSVVLNANDEIMKIIKSRKQTESDFFSRLVECLRRKSLALMTFEDQIQWSLKKLGAVTISTNHITAVNTFDIDQGTDEWRDVIELALLPLKAHLVIATFVLHSVDVEIETTACESRYL